MFLINPKHDSVAISSHISSPWAWLSVSTDLPYLNVSCKCNYMVCDLLWLASFTQQKVFKLYSCCSMYQNSTPRYGQLMLHCICTSHVFIHSSAGHLSSLCIMAIENNFTMKHSVYIFWVDGFILLGGIWILLGVRGLVDHVVSNSRFNFWSTAKLLFTVKVISL